MVYHSIKLLKFKVLPVLEGRKLSVNERWQLLGKQWAEFQTKKLSGKI